MFEGFEHRVVAGAAGPTGTEPPGEVPIATWIGGSGPPVLLLHGFPQTHVMWHLVAPRLAADFTVVATDLRGYGASGKPPAGEDHVAYSKRAMALDQVRVMERLGFNRFHVAGHDRGARCAYRMALDHPERVLSLAVLDIVPTLDALERVDASVAHGLWRWFVLAQRSPIAERLIDGDREAFYFGATAGLFADDALAAYRAAVADDATVRSMCEDYRAAFTVDRRHDEADRDRRTIDAPVLALWGARSNLAAWHDVLAVWQRWATDVQGSALDCGHFLPEEAPAPTAAQLGRFLIQSELRSRSASG